MIQIRNDSATILVDNLRHFLLICYLGCFLLIIWGARTGENPTDYLSHSLVEDSAGGRPMLMIVMGRQAHVYRRDEQKSRQAHVYNGNE